MKTWITGVSILCAMLMLGGCAAPAVGSQASSVPAAEASPVPVVSPEPKVTFTYYVDDVAHFNEDATSEIARELMKRTNVEVIYVSDLLKGMEHLSIIAISEDDFPEVIGLPIARRQITLNNLVERGAVYCINDLMETYQPEMLNNIDPDSLRYYRYRDGKNYYWVNNFCSSAVHSRAAYAGIDEHFVATTVRKDVFEAVDAPDIAGKGEQAYIDLMVKIKQQFPDMETLHMGCRFPTGGLFMSTNSPNWSFHGEFGLRQYCVDDHGVVTSSVRSKKFYEMLSFMNKLYRAGVICPTSFTDDADIFENKVYYMQPAAYHGPIGHDHHRYSLALSPLADVVQLPHFKQGSIYVKNGAAECATMVSTTAKGEVLEGVMRWLAYQTTLEGRRLCSWGIEGRHWQWSSEKENVPARTALWKEQEDLDAAVKKWGIGQTTSLQDWYHRNAFAHEGKWAFAYADWYDLYGECVVVDNFDAVRNPPLDNSTEGVILAKLNECAYSNWAKLVMAESEDALKANCDAFIAECDAIGLPAIEEYWTNRWNLFCGE